MTIVNAVVDITCSDIPCDELGASAHRLHILTRVENQLMKETVMFVRQVTGHFKPGKFDLLTKRLEKEVIPLLKKQKGFRDELSFFDTEKDEAVAMSFWDSKKDADLYGREVYPQIYKNMEDTFVDTPIIRQFEIANSTWYGIHAA